MYELRPYQKAAVDAAYNFVRFNSGHGYVTAPGGSGKSVMIAKLAEKLHHELGYNVLILARSERLLSQNGQKIEGDVGYYCAGLKQKDLTKPITVASVQSLAAAELFPIENLIVICDEAHQIPTKKGADDWQLDQDGNLVPPKQAQYWKILDALGNPRIIGFTATPFRTGEGVVQWGEEIISIPLKPLFDEGYIVPPKVKLPFDIDTSQIAISMGEFNESELENMFLQPEMLHASMEYLVSMRKHYNHVLVFCQSLKHCNVIADLLGVNGLTALVVSGDTPKKELNETIIPSFEGGEPQYLLNCNLMTTGYDIPCIDAVVLLRSSISKGLVEQMVYRGTRTCLGKENFALVDMGGNLKRLGALGSPCREKQKRKGEKQEDAGKLCPECESFISPPNARECPNCGYEFIKDDPRKVHHDTKADTESDPVHNSIAVYKVDNVFFDIHTKRATGAKSIKITYVCPSHPKYGISQWFSVHHENEWVRKKADAFLEKMGIPMPWDEGVIAYSFEELIKHLEDNFPPIKEIAVDISKSFPEIIRVEIDKDPKPPEEVLNYDEIPF